MISGHSDNKPMLSKKGPKSASSQESTFDHNDADDFYVFMFDEEDKNNQATVQKKGKKFELAT